MYRYTSEDVVGLIRHMLGNPAARQDAAGRGIRADAIDAAFIARELNALSARTYDVKYVELKGRRFVPQGGDVPRGATTFSYKQNSLRGKAKVGGNLATDIPVSDVGALEFQGKVVPITTSYVFTLMDLWAAQFSGKPLPSVKATAARRAWEEQLDSIIAIGHTEEGLKGILNQPNALTYTVPSGAGVGADETWATKTGAEIYADLVGMVNTVIIETKETERINTIVLPTEAYAIADATPWNTANPTDLSVLGYFRKSHPDIAVESWSVLASIGAAGKDRMVGFRRDPESSHLVLPVDFEQQPMQVEGLTFKTYCIGTTGGVVCPYPKSIVYGDGIGPTAS